MKSLSFSGMIKTDAISKKMNDAIAKMTFSNDTAKVMDTETMEKKIDLVLALVKSMRLQSPASHLGVVIAFSSIASEIPFASDAGISFSWFRIREGEKLVAIPTDLSISSYYLPTLDDVGFNICAQIEDELGQGLSRHIESELISVDPMIRASGESILKEKFYKVPDTTLNFCAAEGIEYSASCSPRNSLRRLSSGNLIMDGVSTVEVNTTGIFLVLSVSTAVVPLGSGSNPLGLDDVVTETRSSRYLKKGASLFSVSKKDRRQSLSDSRITLHIPAAETITVRCTQPSSLVLSIALQRLPLPYASQQDTDRVTVNTTSSADSAEDPTLQNSDKSNNNNSNNYSNGNGNGNGNSSILTDSNTGMPIAPWSYIQSHNEKAVDVTDDDEIEASDFARTLSSLERYIACLPPDAVDVKISITCSNRLQRDTLVLAIRALAAHQSTANAEARRATFPWSVSEAPKVPQDALVEPANTASATSTTPPATPSASSATTPATTTTDTTSAPSSATTTGSPAAPIDSPSTPAVKTTHKQLLKRIALHDEKEAKSAAASLQLKEKNDALTISNKNLETAKISQDEKILNFEKKIVDMETSMEAKLTEFEEIKAELAIVKDEKKTATELLAALQKSVLASNTTIEQLKIDWQSKEKDFLKQIESLTSQIASTAVINADLQKSAAAELEKHKALIKASETAAAEAKKAAESAAAEVAKVAESAAAEETELRTTSESLQGEINRLKRCTESQSRDLKRAIREKDNLEKALLASHASAAAAAAASDVAARKSPETPALLERLQVPFKSLKTTAVSPLSKGSAAAPPEVSYIKGTVKSSSHASSKGAASQQSETNPFESSPGSGRRVEEGDYSDCDNESEDEDDSDDEPDSPSLPTNPFESSAVQLE